MLSSLNFIYLEYGIDSLEFLLISSSMIIAIIFSMSIGYLLVLHLNLISKGVTTLEYFEKYKKDFKKIKKTSSKIENFKKVLGEKIWLWLVPVDGDKTLQGYKKQNE
jgi:hypothetical protein